MSHRLRLRLEALRTARERASAAGFRVLSASGGELERELGLGVVRQLFEALLVRARIAEREQLLVVRRRGSWRCSASRAKSAQPTTRDSC